MADDKKTTAGIEGQSADTAAIRLIDSVSEKLRARDERIKRDVREIDIGAAEHFRSIRDGGRRFKRPFRP